jgi:D-lactate dehydrogenase (cytochrome)
MGTYRIIARPPRVGVTLPEVATDRDTIASFLEDAAHYTGGHATGVAFPRSEGEVAALLLAAGRVLPIGAQSSLTGGATPMGEVVLSTARLDRLLEVRRDRVRLQPGVPLATLKARLAEQGLYYPPAPTYDGAFVGGTVATNASGAATFKYGSTRNWVMALTVALASGELLDVERGEVTANDHGEFEIRTSSGTRCLRIPTYLMPDVPKRSAGYYAAPGMDLIDLFIGSEGTLGVILEITLGLLPAPAIAVALVPSPSEAAAIELVAALRRTSIDTRRSGDARGIDVAAIEQMDRRCLELLREDGEDVKHHVALPTGTEMALLIQLELPPDLPEERAFDEIASSREPDAPDTPLVRFCRLLDRLDLLEATEIAMPSNRRRAEQFYAVREAVPSAVKQRIAAAKRDVDQSIEKTAADMIVPFDRFGEMLEHYHDAFGRHGFDYAIWGHVSDGNVHPNVIPRSLSEMHAAREVIRQFGDLVIGLGGCPLAEHGVGRSPLKQALLRQLYGQAGIAEMRAIKAALDPGWKLSPGVLFPAEGD